MTVGRCADFAHRRASLLGCRKATATDPNEGRGGTSSPTTWPNAGVGSTSALQHELVTHLRTRWSKHQLFCDV